MLEKYIQFQKYTYFIKENTEFSIILEVQAPKDFLSFITGIIKLVRVSPFGKGGKLHTSFCKITTQEYKETDKITILEKDLNWDFFKAPGPGGQHKNKTMSAVRLIHLPTSTVVISANERSQYDNKRKALIQLESELEKKQKISFLEEKQKSWQENVSPQDAVVSFYFNHQLVVNEKTGIKSKRLKEVLNGQLNYIQ